MNSVRFLLLSFMVFFVSTAFAKPAVKQLASAGSDIVAVINDEALTSYDMDARVRFIIATAKISPNPEAIARLKPQIIRSLIDERLQLQEAKRNNITVSDKEVTQAIAGIENQRNMPAGAIDAMLNQRKIPAETLTNQIRAQVSWSKLLSRKVRSSIHITDEEIDLMAKKLSQPRVKQELEIALLQLPVDKPAREGEVRRIAEKLVLEVRGGANFEEVSRQFAGGAARENGKLSTFWVRPEQLDPAIERALVNAKAGYVSEPLRNTIGYAVIKVYNTREIADTKSTGTEVTLKEITLKLRSSADQKEADTLLQIAEEIVKHPGSCEEKNIAGIKNMETAAINIEQTTQMLDTLPPALKILADGMKVGDISSPLASDEGIKLFMLCGKREGVTATIDRKQAEAAVFQSRMELEAQKYMRNLRRDSFIDIR